MATYYASGNYFSLAPGEIEFAIPKFVPGTANPLPANARIQGNDLANILTGDATDNLLNGLGGADTLTGGQGDDIYAIWSSAAVIRELAGEGTDYIQAFASYVMPEHVEVLELNGSGDFTVTGNGTWNRIYGTGGNNKLSGQGGNDTMSGFEGNDTLDGGTGSDVLTGGTGDDVFYIDNLADQVIEEVGQGRDTVLTSVSFSLGSNEIETLTAMGSAGIRLTGNAHANTLNGNSGRNVLRGDAGNDIVSGKGGHDKFVFDTKLGTSKTDRTVNFDRLVDFDVADSIWLDDRYFNNKALKLLGKKASETKPKQLSGTFFISGSKAKDKDDYIIYNKKTGVLSYDPDGSGSKQAIEFAQLKKNLKITAKDFFII
ncbi:Ca2+-binding RTX toxin-like protein [Microvirga flocculans]|uniref:Ca2+-binding RTX toxin-like protein n=1 Tax=Microvirga flocculans TaxID=217168 RepID=A0A7W6N9B4_9HYPH|nr:calcium-binding protein [Microvirga flocculans]MBB4041298.1 Ca2+-binding RTX toxin-like protein [Microvirga flocculans]